MAPWMVWLAAAAVIWFPGIVLLMLLRRRSSDGFAAAGEGAALGIAFWPVAFLLSDFLGLRWNALLVRAVVIGLGCASAAILIRRRKSLLRKPDALDLTAVALIGVVVWTRVQHAAGVSLPLWVDSVHHTMIVRLLLESGGLPDTYEPFIADGRFYYHWGFHALAAAVAWLTGAGTGEAVARMLLQFGQFLNVLTFFAVYAGAKRLFRSRRTSLLAAVLATLVSFFPAYYISWGRYTQLCGLLLLPIAAVLFWDLGRHPRRSGGLALAFVSAGLLLVHVRVAAMFALVALVLVVLLVLQRQWRGLLWCGAAAAATLLVASPWLVHLAATPEVRAIVSPRAAEQMWETSDVAPPDLLWAPNNVPLLLAATGGIAALLPLTHLTIPLRVVGVGWWLVLVVLLERNARRQDVRGRRFDGWRVAVVAASTALIVIAANGHHLGLPRVRLVPNGAVIIMLFLPLALSGAHLLRWGIDAAFATMRRRSAMTLGIAIVVALAGAWTMRAIVNPVTLLATEADREALAWIRSATPRDARFVVGVQTWIAHSYVGTDGGYWIPVAADRRSILPPGLYPWVMSDEQLEKTTAVLDRWYAAQQTADATIFSSLRQQGFTHLYVGTRNESAIRMLARRDLRPLYASGGVEIFALR